ncbi:hypothetical protein [Microbacterium terrisoli]|uniref:hypothetical protein n=1 Tax=Microbacterium terrisoli TaxID=3242192 RepID=UPI0028064662|nr:hypothetical protein [Microbacterium protaetiae]
MSETYAERRERICQPVGTAFYDYDMAYLFGYEPESWDGMYKLRAHWPIIRLSKRWAIAAEVVGMRVDRRGRQVQRIHYRLVKARA